MQAWKAAPIPEGETSDDKIKQKIQTATEDTIKEARKLSEPVTDQLVDGTVWAEYANYLGHSIYIQTHKRLEFAHPYIRELISLLLPPDWDCFVDRKKVGLNFATPFYAKRNGVAFVLKQVAAREGRTIRLAEEEQATRPKLHSYQERGQRVELFVTEKSGLFGPKGWTCMVDGELVGFGFRSRRKAWSNAFLYTMNRKSSRAGESHHDSPIM